MDPLTPELLVATALHRDGRLREAEALYRSLLNHVSQSVQAHSALGLLLSQQGRFAEARKHYEQVVQQSPDDFLAHKLLGDACSEEGEVEASAVHYRIAARRQPESWFWQLRADIVSPLVFESTTAIETYRTQLANCLRVYRDAPHQLDPDELAASGCKPPISLAYHGCDDRPIKELFASIFAERLPADLPRCNSGKPHVAFVVTEGNEGVFLRGMAGVLRHLDLQQLKVTVVCAPSAKDKMREAIGRDLDYLLIGNRLTDTIEAVRSARFDLLYYWEIGTDCVNYLLPFFRLAPVQCTSWGWPVTSGLGEVDYFLSSDWLEPVGAEQHYTEKLVRLRHVPNYYDVRPPLDPANAREQFGLSDHQHVYFCGQNPRKLHPDFDANVGQILRCDAEGVVVLIEAAKPAVTEALRRRMQTTLPDCAKRIRWLPRMTRSAYLAWMAAADCVLDTPHYCGGANSTYDAFSVAAPVVTLTGQYHRGRYTTAAYRRMGLLDCIAATPSEYIDIALHLASDRDFSDHTRRQIAERQSVLVGNLAAVREFQDWVLNAIARVR